MFRTSHVFGELEEQHFLYHIMSTGAKDFHCPSMMIWLLGRYFLSFWGPMKTDSKHQKDYIIDVFDRATHTKGWNYKYLKIFLDDILKIFFFK